jgi:hypothetical protein
MPRRCTMIFIFSNNIQPGPWIIVFCNKATGVNYLRAPQRLGTGERRARAVGLRLVMVSSTYGRSCLLVWAGWVRLSPPGPSCVSSCAASVALSRDACR